MIFIGLFLFIALVVILLNAYNHSNLAQIEDYLEKNSCKDYSYSKGSYKAFCDDYFMEIKNGFIINFDENRNIFMYKDINSMEINQLNIIINKDYKISFKEQNEVNAFYNQLSEKISKQDK